jgi:hypothetical protein
MFGEKGGVEPTVELPHAGFKTDSHFADHICLTDGSFLLDAQDAVHRPNSRRD